MGTSTSAATCTLTLFSRAALPCSRALTSVSTRRSPLWHRPPSRLRLWPRPSVSTRSGLAGPSCPRFPPSRRCGSPRTSTTSLAPASSTASASKHLVLGTDPDYTGGRLKPDPYLAGDFPTIAVSATVYSFDVHFVINFSNYCPVQK